jgi:RNA polymerase-binding transcription factor DksA
VTTKQGKSPGDRRERSTGNSPRSRRTTTAAAKAPLEDKSIPPKWKWHYGTLCALRDRLMQDSRRKLHDMTEAIEPHSMHLADSATDEFDHDLGLALLAREDDAITQINDAITRIVEGTYGRCEASGRRIPAARLRAIPWCRYDREVEQRFEETGRVAAPGIPQVVPLWGVRPQLPGTGKLPREGMDGEAEDESDELERAKVVKEISSLSNEAVEAPGGPVPGEVEEEEKSAPPAAAES